MILTKRMNSSTYRLNHGPVHLVVDPSIRGLIIFHPCGMNSSTCGLNHGPIHLVVDPSVRGFNNISSLWDELVHLWTSYESVHLWT